MTINTFKIIYFRTKEILQRYFHGFSNLSFYNIGHGTEWLSHKVLEDYSFNSIFTITLNFFFEFCMYPINAEHEE